MTSPVPAAKLTGIPELGPRADIGIAERRRILAEAAAQSWLARNPLGFTVLHYADARSILRDRRWASATGLVAGLSGVTDEVFLRRRRLSILAMEGADHDRLRRLVASSFTPHAAESVRPRLAQAADDLIVGLEAERIVDAVEDLCSPYAVAAICVMLDLPSEDWTRFTRWASGILGVLDADVREKVASITAAEDELDAYVADLLRERSAAPGSDLLSRLVATADADDTLSDEEIASLVGALIVAGVHTVRSQMASAIALLAPDRGWWSRLATDEDFARRAVDEAIRHLGAVRGTVRIATEDIVHRDVHFPAGTVVSISLASANADPAAFPEAMGFDPDRSESAPHVGFGVGVHHCLGASLARAEIHEGLSALARRRPDLALAGAPLWRPGTAAIFGPETLPVLPGALAPG